jgi:hypothetical protein
VFNKFIALINIAHGNIDLHWITNLNTIINHLVFEFVGQDMWATIFVRREIYGNVAAL